MRKSNFEVCDEVCEEVKMLINGKVVNAATARTRYVTTHELGYLVHLSN